MQMKKQLFITNKKKKERKLKKREMLKECKNKRDTEDKVEMSITEADKAERIEDMVGNAEAVVTKIEIMIDKIKRGSINNNKRRRKNTKRNYSIISNLVQDHNSLIPKSKYQPKRARLRIKKRNIEQ